VVYVCGLGQFELRLNGRKVGDDVLAPGWTNYRKTCLYSAYDVTGQLARGANAIGVMLGNGMYNVPGGRYTKFTGSFGPTKMILQLHVEYADGTSSVVASDNSWTWALSPVVFSCTYGGEDYDARREMPGWDTPGFTQDTAWRKAVEVPGPGGRLVCMSQSAPPIKVLQTFDAAPPVILGPGISMYDLGQNGSFLPRITVQGPPGARVKIETGERWENGKFSGACDEMASFNYTLRGSGQPENWAPRFTYAGARYLRVTCSAPEGSDGQLPKVLKVQGDFITSSSAEAGSFESSSELFNGTDRIIRWAIRSNMMSILTDCPHREKLGWLEQVYLVGPSLIYSYDIQCLLIKMAGDMADAQLADGLVPDIAPEYTVFKDGFRDSPEWGSSSVLTPWMIYQSYGDSEILSRHYETMARYVAYLESKANANILTHGLGDWYGLAGSKSGATATAVYFLDLKVMENAAKVLDKTADAQNYAAKAEVVRQAYNKLLFANGSYGGQTDNAMPLAMGIAEASDRPAALQSLIADIRNRGNALTAGDIGYRFLLRALAQEGRSDVIYDMSTGADKPGYAMILAKGNTALTEPWDGSGSASSNHFMLGHIMEWFYADLAGIQAGAPGFKRILIKPQPVGDISWVKAHYDSPYGRIASNWTRDEQKLTMNVTIPPNTTATVYVPAKDAAVVTESGKPASDVAGVKFMGMENNAAVYEVASGTYQFQSSLTEAK
jgi:alpha-L-rhamnosidase